MDSLRFNLFSFYLAGLDDCGILTLLPSKLINCAAHIFACPTKCTDTFFICFAFEDIHTGEFGFVYIYILVVDVVLFGFKAMFTIVDIDIWKKKIMKNGGITGNWLRMDVSHISEFSFSSETYRLCLCHYYVTKRKLSVYLCHFHKQRYLQRNSDYEIMGPWPSWKSGIGPISMENRKLWSAEHNTKTLRCTVNMRKFNDNFPRLKCAKYRQVAPVRNGRKR